MSLPKFPSISPPMTKDESLSMILASIAMEELGLSHIINAEGEKLQYVLGTLDGGPDEKASVEEVLAVNKSVKCLLDSILQNQVILKGKMESALCAMEEGGSGKTGPTGPTEPVIIGKLQKPRITREIQNLTITITLQESAARLRTELLPNCETVWYTEKRLGASLCPKGYRRYLPKTAPNMADIGSEATGWSGGNENYAAIHLYRRHI